MVRTEPRLQGRLELANALYQMDNRCLFRAVSTAGTMVAACRHVKTKLNWVIAFAVGLLAPLALPAEGAVEIILDAVEWIGDSPIAAFAVAANALTIIP